MRRWSSSARVDVLSEVRHVLVDVRPGRAEVPAGDARALALAPGPELAPAHSVSRPRGTGSVGDSVGEG